MSSCNNSEAVVVFQHKSVMLSLSTKAVNITAAALTTCRTKNIVQAAVQKRNSEALSAMTFAATLGDVDSMEHLLQRGLLINTADYDGRTTLHLAALEGNVKVLELLLQEGAEPNVRDRCECSTVHLCRCFA